jgi:hypothetical protein
MLKDKIKKNKINLKPKSIEKKPNSTWINY